KPLMQPVGFLSSVRAMRQYMGLEVAESDAQSSDLLAHIVMQFPGYSSPFLFLGMNQPLAQIPDFAIRSSALVQFARQPVIGGQQFLLGAFAVRDVEDGSRKAQEFACGRRP